MINFAELHAKATEIDKLYAQNRRDAAYRRILEYRDYIDKLGSVDALPVHLRMRYLLDVHEYEICEEFLKGG